mgnify:CR=1 FL=1
MMNDNYIYFIVYPGGDRTKLSVCHESTYTEYEIKYYDLASRKRWDNPEEANTYCKTLAKENNLIYVNDDDGYLD